MGRWRRRADGPRRGISRDTVDSYARTVPGSGTIDVEELIDEPEERDTIVIVTDNLQQATPAASLIALMRDWELVPRGPTTGLFTNPEDERGVRDVGGDGG